ncbi:PEP-CTERM sorting domain-containing protein [Nodularia sp. UHCC 0506]|uniref:PEP-CTERM sorting domain-containing protein n=1 Tax=Nodularia sp. UHCC 0506 TaxID=3110243 RepID=UPI002B1EC97B|nr:PEP-CTERM sorting domain-containing protein [Nodularia sp. UHCC 0506]MEA5516264.1 PEP-CTERM sorting domain-containing protein [Nodularia sp. UHCC 0506]
MSISQKVSLALLGTSIVFMSANPASAISLTKGGSTLVSGEGQYTNIQGATTINFNDGVAPSSGLVTYSANTQIVQGNKSGEYATPFGNTSKYLTVSPNTGNVTINFAAALDYFGFYWGSIDTYNFVDVYSGGSLIKTFSGADVPGAPANGEQSGNVNNVYVNLLGGQGETFDKVVFRSTGFAFENDNHSYRLATVPEPTTILGLLAFGALGGGSLLKRKSKMA